MENKKSTFIMYPTDFLAAVHNFTKRETGELIIALCEYNLYEKISLKISNDVKDKFSVLQKIIDENVVPKSGFAVDNGAAQVYGRENKFDAPLIEGTWKEVKDWFLK